MWVLANQAYSDHPMRVFRYAPSRAGKEARELLNGFSGYLHTDDYAGYNRVPAVKRCLCWAHYPRYIIIRERMLKTRKIGKASKPSRIIIIRQSA